MLRGKALKLIPKSELSTKLSTRQVVECCDGRRLGRDESFCE